MKKSILALSVLLLSYSHLSAQERPAPGSFLVYTFDYTACDGTKVKCTYPEKVKAPDVTDPNLYKQEATAEITVDGDTGAVLSTKFLTGSKALYSAIEGYAKKRSLKAQNTTCFIATYRVLTFSEAILGPKPSK